jgi:hypothetical protein
MTTADFVDLWAIGDNSFETDPPNAVLAFLEPDADVPDDAVVVLREPNLDGGGDLAYSIELLEGTVPTQTGPVTLFIDPFGGRSRPSRCAECAGAAGDGRGAAGSEHAGRRRETP